MLCNVNLDIIYSLYGIKCPVFRIPNFTNNNIFKRKWRSKGTFPLVLTIRLGFPAFVMFLVCSGVSQCCSAGVVVSPSDGTRGLG